LAGTRILGSPWEGVGDLPLVGGVFAKTKERMSMVRRGRRRGKRSARMVGEKSS